jgi:predicted  nucleic acid-binding Zn-ribbon protein
MTKKLTHEEFVEKANEVHNFQYEYLSEYVNSYTKLKMKHKVCEYEFEQKPGSHIHLNNGCPKCGIDKSRKKSYSNEKFVEKANEVHNFEYEYLSEYIDSHTKIKMKHKSCGHIFEQITNDHLNNSGCPKCSKCYRLSHKEFVEKANEVHNFEYEYLSEYVNSKQKIKMKHKICGRIFEQSPYVHYNYGCVKCSIKIKTRIETQKLTHKEFVEKANEVHNFEYEYLSEYIDSHTKNKNET